MPTTFSAQAAQARPASSRRHAMASGAACRPPARFARRFLPTWGLGLVGVASLLVQAPPPALFDLAPALRELPAAGVRLLLLVNPLILVTAMAALGAALAHRVGLRSALAGDAGARVDPWLAAIVGMVVALVLMAIDAAVAGSLGPAWQAVRTRADASPAWPTLLPGLLYGGLAEEVMTRWGLMSLVVWAVLRLRQPQAAAHPQPSVAAAWTGIVVASVLFAAAHLPALAQEMALSGPVVARTVALNLLAGMAYGWLFWRRSLETAMLAHATTHIGLALGRWIM